MSGHSKWSTIKRQKGVADAKRGQTFTKLANAITIIAKETGVADPEQSPRLRIAVETARTANMPKENIQRAIDRGLGRLPGQVLEEVHYEGFGPAKAAFIALGFTDNKMRTTQEVKNLIERNGGVLGAPGSTSYMFDKVGEIHVQSKGGSVDDELLELIDTGASDVEDYEDEGKKMYLVTCQSSELNTMGTKITQLGYSIVSSEIVYRPNITVQVGAEDADRVEKFFEKIEDHDDIQNVFFNAESVN